MATAARPSWMSDFSELDEEWPASPSPPPEDRALTFGQATTVAVPSSLKIPKRIGTDSFHKLDYGDSSRPAGDASSIRSSRAPSPPSPMVASETGSVPVGTVVVKDDQTSSQGGLGIRNPFTPAKTGQKGGIGGGIGGGQAGMKDFFAPLALESMFEPPSPPTTSQQEASDSVAQHSLLSPPSQTQQAFQSPTQPSPPQSESTSPNATSPSVSPCPMPRPRHGQQQLHAPPRPSRLATAFTPDDLTASTITVPEHDQDGFGETEQHKVELRDKSRSEDEIVESDIPNLGFFDGRKQSQAFEFSCPAPSPPHSSHGSHTSLKFPSVGSQSLPPDRYPQGFNSDSDRYRDGEGSDEEDDALQRQPSIRPTQRNDSLATPSAALSHTGKKLNLFQPQFDTFTRDFMSAMVDDIEGSSSSPSSSTSAGASIRSRTMGVEASPRTDTSTTSDDVDLPFRSSKRIKLSPIPRAVSGGSTTSGGASEFERERERERLKRSQSTRSYTGTGTTGTSGSGGTAGSGKKGRDWEVEAEEMMRKVKELGLGRARAKEGTNLLDEGGWGRGASMSFSGEGDDNGAGESTASDDQGGTVRRRETHRATRDDAASPSSIPPTPPMKTERTLPSEQPASGPSRQSAYIQAAAGLLSRLPARLDTSDDETTSAAYDTVGSRHSSGTSKSSGGGMRAAVTARLHAVDEGKTTKPPLDAGPSAKGSFEEMRAKKQSPRKLLRRMSAADEVERELKLEGDVSTIKEDSLGVDVTQNASAHSPAPPSSSLANYRPGRGSAPSRPTSQQTNRSGGSSSRPLTSQPLATIESGQSLHLTSDLPSLPAPAEDLNRYVSSATVLSTVGVSTISSSSFVKHPGRPPRNVGGKGMISIPLAETETPRVIGRMEYDQVGMRWVKTRKTSPSGGLNNGTWKSEEDDPFRDMDSTRGSEGMRALDEENEAVEHGLEERERRGIASSVLDERDQSDQSDEMSRSLDDKSSRPEQVAPKEEVTQTPSSLRSFQFPSSRSNSPPLSGVGTSPPPQSPPTSNSDTASQLRPTSDVSSSVITHPVPPHLAHHPHSAPVPLAATPAPSSRQCLPLRMNSGGGLRPFATPVSVLKKRSPALTQTPYPHGGVGANLTPGSSGPHRRSVSFSDGRKQGKILDLGEEKENGRQRVLFTSENGDSNGEQKSFNGGDGERSAFLPSARTSRIQNILHGLEDETEVSIDNIETPSKASLGSSIRAQGHSVQTHQVSHTSYETSSDRSDDDDDTTTVGLPANRSNAAARSFHYSGRRPAKPGDATFLTECSFNVARDHLVEIITEVHPFVVNWEDLDVVNLEGKRAGSVARLKEFLPRLREANLVGNELDYLSGLPTSVEILHAAFNRITALTAVAHLPNLKVLDLSNNQLDAVHPLSCLENLRELILDNNAISDLSPLFEIRSLVNLSVGGNTLESIDLKMANWPNLDTLILNRNKIHSVFSLHCLTSLRTLELNSNELIDLTPESSLHKLRTLKVSQNRLTALEVGRHFPGLLLLYADQNRLRGINGNENVKRKRLRIETLSLRSQDGGQIILTSDELHEVKRLYLCGNALPPTLFYPSVHTTSSPYALPLPNLKYLELASCSLSVLSLPLPLSTLMPNLRSLNLNYNFLSSSSLLHPLLGLESLRKLSVVGGRMRDVDSVLKLLAGCKGLEKVDLRMNPFSLEMYRPLLILPTLPFGGTPSSPTITPSPTSTAFSSTPNPTTPSDLATGNNGMLDEHFRRSLPGPTYLRRLHYRGSAMKLCPSLDTLDAVEIVEGERAKARELFAEIEIQKRHRDRQGRGIDEDGGGGGEKSSLVRGKRELLGVGR